MREPCDVYTFDADIDLGVDWIDELHWSGDGEIFATHSVTGRTMKLTTYTGEDVLEAKAAAVSAAEALVQRVRSVQQQQVEKFRKSPKIPMSPTEEELISSFGHKLGDPFDFYTEGDTGDRYCHYCEDCETYHAFREAHEIRIRHGRVVEFNIHSTDTDGDSDVSESWSDADRISFDEFSRRHLNLRNGDCMADWAEYHLWCLEHDQDPLGDCLSIDSPWTTWTLRAATHPTSSDGTSP